MPRCSRLPVLGGGLFLLSGCLSPLVDVSESDDEGMADETGADDRPTTRGEDGDGPHPLPELGPCADYIQCIREASPDDAPRVHGTYGEMGTCWERPNVEPQDCWMECSAELERMARLHPEVQSCCPSGDCVEAPDFAVIEDLIRERCVPFCHEPGGLWAGFDMSVDLHAKLVGVTSPTQGQQCNLVEPGVPHLSYLWHKLHGSHVEHCAGAGIQMPARHDLDGSDPLPQAELDLFTAWILAGAPP